MVSSNLPKYHFLHDYKLCCINALSYTLFICLRASCRWWYHAIPSLQVCCKFSFSSCLHITALLCLIILVCNNPQLLPFPRYGYLHTASHAAHVNPFLKCVVLLAARPGYVDPGPVSAIFQIATTYCFTSLMISVGTSYFRRLAASNYAMLQAGLTSPQFYSFMLPMEVYPLEKSSKPLVGVIHAKYLPTNEAWLTLIHLTCIYLAAKVLEYVPCKNMLQTMMGHIYGAEPCKVSTYLVSQLELECLSALDWRLGPVYQSNL